MLELGPWQISSVVLGSVRLDGGAMFGVVPRTLWAQQKPPDPDNRILLATRTLLAVHRRAGLVVLVDTGPGSKWTADVAARYVVTPQPEALSSALASCGAGLDDVTDVVATHLHFDHAGGMTDWVDEPAGPTRLRFPQARHWLHRTQWDHAHHPTRRDKASYLSADFADLPTAAGFTLLDGDPPAARLPDLYWRLSHGHTPAQLLPVFDSGDGREVTFVGDLIPMAAHLPPTWVMGYDLHPVITVAEREALYGRCRTHDVFLAFPHNVDFGMATVAFDRDRPVIGETCS